MAIVISLLRGVNVGGNNKIKMDALRAIYESVGGVERPETYIQSGNVIFSTRERNLAKLRLRLEEAIERSAGFRVPVVLRTLDQMREVVARNPFAARAAAEPAKLLVTFLFDAPEADAVMSAAAIKIEPDEMRIQGSEMYVYFPNGQGQSKLPAAKIERALGVTGTGRNWNTVLKLIELAEVRI